MVAPKVVNSKDESDVDFAKLVQKVMRSFTGNTVVKDEQTPNYDDVKKRIAEMGKQFDVDPGPGGATLCCGALLKGPQFISLLFVRKPPQKVYSTISYVHLKQKVLVVTIARSRDKLDEGDLDILRDTTEKYTRGILALNTPAAKP